MVKPYLLARWEKLSFTASLASSLLERGMDLFALVLIWFVFVLSHPGEISPEAQGALEILNRVSYFLMGMAVPVGLFTWWLAPRHRILDRWASRSPRFRRYPIFLKILRVFFKFAAGLEGFRRKRTIVYVTLLSVAAWGAVVLAAWALLRALGLHLPWSAGVVLLMFITLGAAVPTPGGVGGVHKAISWCLVLFYAVDEDKAVTAGILGHAVMFFPAILWGIFYFLLGRVRLGEIRQAAQESSG